LYGGVLRTSEASERAKRPKFKRLRRSNVLIFSRESLPLLLLPIHCREGSEGAGKQCVMRIIIMTETLAEPVISEVIRERILWEHKSYHSRLRVDREWSKIAENVGEKKSFFSFISDLRLYNPITLKEMRNKTFSNSLLFSCTI
jgi:hypothetical protein